MVNLMNRVNAMILFFIANLQKNDKEIQSSFRLDKKRVYEIVILTGGGGNNIMNHFQRLSHFRWIAEIGISSGLICSIKDLLLYKRRINMDFMTMAKNGIPG
jgi:hypothetical protein